MHYYNATLVRVIDGDTVDAMIDLGFDIQVKKRIRLAGINAPESRTRNKVEKKLGLVAKERLIQLMDGAANCFEIESKEIGKYGRVLGIIYINKLAGKDVITKACINEILVDEGHATKYDGGKRI